MALYVFCLTIRKNPNNPNILNMKVYEYIWKTNEYICPKTQKKTLSIIFYDMSTIQFFGCSLYNGDNNLKRVIHSLFVIAQPVEAKNK